MNVTLTGVFMKVNGSVSAGEAVSCGGGADHVRTAATGPGQDEGSQEDLQVRLTFTADTVLCDICQTQEGARRRKLLRTY